MNDNFLFDSEKLPEKRLVGNVLLAPEELIPGDYVVKRSREKLARQLVEKILSDESFFKYKDRGRFIDISVDCIVLTVEEYRAERERLFQRGMDFKLRDITDRFK